MPAHHPGPELLFDYAAGSLREVQALLVASHLAYCADCRRQVAELEACGGVLLEEVAAEPVSDSLLDAVLATIANAPAAPPQPPPEPAKAPNGVLPGPLHRALGGSLDGVDWVRIVPGIHLSGWSLGVGTASACLLRMAAGASVPAHRHTDHEMLLVLTGAFSDEFGRYRVGDVASYDPETPHHAVADRDGECLCLLVQDNPLVFTGALGWLLNRGFRF
ncbi:ChrR family anti-sigma-E factor [Azospirillum canadense]|uniref:ChrR family anti-sigma-E factor n=1 Tax=Azospirillum canadense TaxID=403962 RepID=UPI00222756B1|nr:ChrR family anti-sigma-E factor [Azospirillum canadense]